MKKLLITHSDLDMVGIITLVIYYKIHYDDILMINYVDDDYLKCLDYIPNYDEIHYADFSPDEKSMELLEKLNKKVIIYDHHDTAYQRLKEWKYENKEYYYEDGISGTEIYYKNNIKINTNKIINAYVELISVFDTGKKKSPLYSKACNLNRLLYQTKNWGKEGLEQYQFFIEGMIRKFDSYGSSFEFTKWENAKIQKAVQKEKDIFKELVSGKRKIKTRKDKKERYFSIIRLTSKTNEICNMMLDKYSKLDYIIVINEYDTSKLKLSIRSRDTINLLEYKNVAGHPNAAGFEDITNEICEDLWNGKIYCLEDKEKLME